MAFAIGSDPIHIDARAPVLPQGGSSACQRQEDDVKPRSMVAAISIMAVVTACTATGPAPATQPPSSSGGPSGAPADDTRRIELTTLNWFNEGPFKAHLDASIADYLAQDPRVTAINVETQPFVRYHDVLNVKIGAGNPPDVAWIRKARRDSYIDAGHLVDLAPIIAEQFPDYDLDDFGRLLTPYVRGEQIFGIPQTHATWAVLYNIDLFEAADLKTPDEHLAEGTWTYETMMETAKALVDSGAAPYGFLHQGLPFTNGWQGLAEYYASNGAAPWSEDGKTCTFNSPEMVAAIQAYHDMTFTDRAAPLPGDPINFASGEVGMLFGRPGFSFMLDDATFEWGIVRGPEGTAGYVPEFGGHAIGAMADAANPDIAAAFAVSTLTKEHLAILSVNGNPSPRTSGRTAEVLAATNSKLTPEQIENTLVAALDSEEYIDEIAHKNFGPIFAQSQPIFDGQIWVEGADVQAGLDAVCAAIGPILEE